MRVGLTAAALGFRRFAATSATPADLNEAEEVEEEEDLLGLSSSSLL